MSTNSLLTPCKVRYFHVTPLALAMSTNSLLTPCKQGAVHFSPMKQASLPAFLFPQRFAFSSQRRFTGGFGQKNMLNNYCVPP